MPDGPYRPRPAASDAGEAIERLAAKGHRALLEARATGETALAAEERRLGERHLRVALGDHHGAPIRTAGYAVVGAGALTVAAGFLTSAYLAVPGGLAMVVGFLVGMNARPTATRARVAAERAWLSSLPFVVEGYFDALAGAPRIEGHLAVTVAWSERRAGPDEDMVHGLLGALDTSAQIEACDDEGFGFRSGPISGLVGVRLREGLRNTRIVAYVHRLVDTVLVPLHGVRAIARVSVVLEA